MPSSWFAKNERLMQDIAALQKDIATEPFVFARELAKNEIAMMPLAIEAACFYLHALNWVIARSAQKHLGKRLYEPTVNRLCEVFPATIRSQDSSGDSGRIELRLEKTIRDREFFYAEAQSLLGRDAEDGASALHLASQLFSALLGSAEAYTAARMALLRGIDRLKLVERVRAVERLLT